MFNQIRKIKSSLGILSLHIANFHWSQIIIYMGNNHLILYNYLEIDESFMAHLKCGRPLGSKDNIERKRKTKCQDHIIVSD